MLSKHWFCKASFSWFPEQPPIQSRTAEDLVEFTTGKIPGTIEVMPKISTDEFKQSALDLLNDEITQK